MRDDNALTVKNSAGYKTEITSGIHTITGDEPVSSGGSNAGPDPYALLLSSLGSCKAITIRMFAERRKYLLKDVIIKLSHKKIHAVDCVECETKEGKIDHINVEIELSGDLTDEQRKSMIDISKKCPVHKTLTSEIKIYTVSVN